MLANESLILVRYALRLTNPPKGGTRSEWLTKTISPITAVEIAATAAAAMGGTSDIYA